MEKEILLALASALSFAAFAAPLAPGAMPVFNTNRVMRKKK